MNASPTDVVLDFIAAWNANDMERVCAFFTDDVFYHNVPMEPVQGRAAVQHYLTSVGRFDWVDWQVRSIAANGNTVLTERIDEFGVSGKHVSLPLMGAFEIRDGRIAAWRDYFDLAMYMRQLADGTAG